MRNDHETVCCGIEMGISRSRETGRDPGSPPRDETFSIPVGVGDPSNNHILIPYVPRSVISFLNTQIKRAVGAGLPFSGEINISLPKIQCNARTAEMIGM